MSDSNANDPRGTVPLGGLVASAASLGFVSPFLEKAQQARAAFESEPITSMPVTTVSTRYAVMIPDAGGVREVRVYPDTNEDGEDGRTLAIEHVALLHAKARGRTPAGNNPRWSEAYAIKRVTTISEQRL